MTKVNVCYRVDDIVLNEFKAVCELYEVNYSDMLKLLINFCISKEKENNNIVLYLKNEIKEEL